MADTFTSTLRLQQPTVGADAATWGGYLNTDLVLIDNAINGVSTINIAGLATYSLTVANGAVDQARNLVYNFTGALGANCTVTLPPNAKFGYAINSTTGGHTVILTTGLGGTTLTLPTAAYYTFFTCDGANVLAPSVGFGYTNILNDLAVSGQLNVNGNAVIAGLTSAQAITATTLTTSGTVTIGTSTYSTNGDGWVPYLNANRSAIINQAVTNTSSPTFSNVNLSGLGFLKSFINQPVLTTSFPTFADVGITGTGNIKGLINQVLTTTANPQFNNIFLGYLGDWLSNKLGQDVRSGAGPTFADIHLNYIGANLSGYVNQPVISGSGPTFQDIHLNYLATNLSSVLGQDVRSSANATFNNVFVTALGDFITGRLGQDVRSGASPGFANLTSAGTVEAFSNSTQCFHAPSGGGAAALGWVTGSDIAYKTDVHTITGALDKLAAFRGVSFTRKLDGKARLGVIGQEVQEQFPEVVDEIDGKLHVDYSALIGPLIEAVKELRAEVASLKAQQA